MGPSYRAHRSQQVDLCTYPDPRRCRSEYTLTIPSTPPPARPARGPPLAAHHDSWARNPARPGTLKYDMGQSVPASTTPPPVPFKDTPFIGASHHIRRERVKDLGPKQRALVLDGRVSREMHLRSPKGNNNPYIRLALYQYYKGEGREGLVKRGDADEEN
jgi:hypothetical protein